MLFEVGDKIVLKNDLTRDEYYGGYYVNDAIYRYRGEQVTISRVSQDGYNIEEIGYLTYITEDMIDMDLSMGKTDNVEYVTCELCGEKVPSYQANKKNGKYYCRDCVEKIYGAIKSYHTKESWSKKYGLGKARLFNNLLGVELEVEGNDRISDNFDACLVAYNLIKEIGDFATIEHDGSLDDGFEIITEPMTMQYIRESELETIEKMLKFLKDNNMTRNCNAGLHVHVDREILHTTSRKEDDVIDNIYLIMETFKEELIRFARREPNEYCSFISDDRAEKNLSYIKRVKRNYTGSRYLAFNITESETVEFRIFKSTLDFKTFMATLELVNNIVNIAKYKKIDGLKWKDIIEYQSNNNSYLVDYNDSLNIYTEKAIVVMSYLEMHKEEFTLNNFANGKFGIQLDWGFNDGVRGIYQFSGMLLAKQLTYHTTYSSMANAIETKTDRRNIIVVKEYDGKKRVITLPEEEKDDYKIVQFVELYNLWLENTSLLA